MDFQTNTHVEQLWSYLPFDTSSDRLYEEHVSDGESVETVALRFIQKEIRAPELQLLVLTGDAGHGKTHLCARLLESLAVPAKEIARALAERCDGEAAVTQLPDGRDLRVIKDLSELDRSRAAVHLAHALEDPDTVLVACANEGRLRAVVKTSDDRLAAVAEGLRATVTHGEVPRGRPVTVVNLNYQSVAAEDEPLVERVLKPWLDGRRWRTCENCAARDGCPIRSNARKLSEDPARIGRLSELLRIGERLGTVVTFREMLVALSLAVTGGIRCREVHRRASSEGWQHRHLFHEALFGDHLTQDQRRSLPVFGALEHLDPGGVSIRAVDDRLVIDAEADNRFLPPGAGVLDSPTTTRREQQDAAERERSLYRFLRRRDFFDHGFSAATSSARVGLRYHDDFRFAISPERDGTPARVREVRDRLILGLEALQGVRGGSVGSLLVVDPAFAGPGPGAKVIARQIAGTEIRLLAESEWWKERGVKRTVQDTVNWLERRLCLAIGRRPDSPVVQLDLLEFELVSRAAEGLSAHRFFEARSRHVLAQLATIAGAGSGDENIQVFYEGRRHRLMIDVGDLIRSAED